MKTLASRILRRFGFRKILVVNAVIASAFLGASGIFTPTTPYLVIVAVLLVGGCFRSLQFTSLNAIGYADMTSADMSAATSLSSVAQQLSLSIGVAMAAFVVETVSQSRGEAELTSADFWPAFVVVALVSASSTLFFMRLKPDAGAEMSGHIAVAAKPTADSQ